MTRIAVRLLLLTGVRTGELGHGAEHHGVEKKLEAVWTG